MDAPGKSPATPPPADGPPPLTQLYVYLTAGCNLACRHCYLAPQFDPHGDRYPVLDIGLFQTALDEARPLGLQSVKLTGGEPLLHPGIERILEILRDAQLRVVVETNGVLCTDALADRIAQCKSPFVSVSLDGADAQTHDRIRGVKGTFEKATEAVRRLTRRGIKTQVIFSILKENQAQVDDIVRLAEELGAESVKFNLVQPMSRGRELQAAGQTPGVVELLALGRHVENDLAPAAKPKLFFDYPMAFRPLSRIASGDADGTCGILNILGVVAQGYYALCGVGEHSSGLVFGKVGADDVASIWHGNPLLLELRSGLPARLEGACRNCLMKWRCLGSCVAETYFRTGKLWSGYWFCESAKELNVFPGSRSQE